jgi:aminoglycoside phosphotransferase (APT) family kinase protein
VRGERRKDRSLDRDGSTMAPRMHPDEIETDAALVRRLLAGQAPAWADLPIERVGLVGTDNTLYRLGEELVVRLPRRRRTAATLAKEVRWLPALAPLLPAPIPVPLAEGKPAEGFPFSWAVYPWLPGERATTEVVVDRLRLAADLAQFIRALQRIDTTGAPAPGEHNFGRGAPLRTRDESVRKALASVDGVAAGAVTAVWEAALRAPAWERPPVWIHGDLDAQNIVVADGRLSGVIDFGGLGAGDPAADVMVAWKILDGDARSTFREALAVDDATWTRSRGWALSQALIALEHYTQDTHPVLVREARRWIDALLAE